MSLHIKRFKNAVSSLDKAEKQELRCWQAMLRNIIDELQSEMGKVD